MVGGTSDLGADRGKALSYIGIDITSVERIRKMAGRRPAALIRLFTEGELADAGSTRQQWPRLAARFAAKEALIKAAGGLHGSAYRDIEVRRQPGAPPCVLAGGPLGEWLTEQHLHISATLSHEDAFAVAWVMLTREGD